MPRAYVVVAAVLLIGTGCSAVSARVHGRTNDPNPAFGGTARDTIGIGRTVPAGRTSPTGKSHSPGIATRRVCRGGAWPSGWIAIGYEASDAQCPRSADARSAYNVATIVRYETLPSGQVLEICADQVIPRGWVNETREDQVGDACPGAAKDGASATRIIRRLP